MLLVCPIIIGAQSFNLTHGKKFQKIEFELINNLIVLPIELNGVKLSFVLDSGVSKPILFNLTSKDSLGINNYSEIFLRGLGGGKPIKALSSNKNIVKLKNFENRNQQVYVIVDKSLNFSHKLGIPIHGIIGYDVFRDFVVEINYAAKFIKIWKPSEYVYRSRKNVETLPLSVENRKAYVYAEIEQGGKKNPVKMLVDTGSSDALWLFEKKERGIILPAKNFEDFLGRGLSGDIHGRRSKIDVFYIGRFRLSKAKSAFPYSTSIKYITNLGDRNGSLGGEVLKKFNIVFDYPSNKITFKKNSYFKKPFQFNTSGMNLQHKGTRYVKVNLNSSRGILKTTDNDGVSNNVTIQLENRSKIILVPQIVITNIRNGSSAEISRLKVGDIILSINNAPVYKKKLQEITSMINQKPGKVIKLLVSRNNEQLLFTMKLQDLFQ